MAASPLGSSYVLLVCELASAAATSSEMKHTNAATNSGVVTRVESTQRRRATLLTRPQSKWTMSSARNASGTGAPPYRAQCRAGGNDRHRVRQGDIIARDCPAWGFPAGYPGPRNRIERRVRLVEGVYRDAHWSARGRRQRASNAPRRSVPSASNDFWRAR